MTIETAAIVFLILEAICVPICAACQVYHVLRAKKYDEREAWRDTKVRMWREAK